MRVRKKALFAGMVIASGAALVIPAAAASASPRYVSIASATAGSLAFGPGPSAPGSKVTATDANPSTGTTTGIYHGDLPNGLGGVVFTNDADLLTTHAQASPNGTSSACSSAFAGACGAASRPLTLALNLQKMAQVANYTAGKDIPFDSLDSLAGSLNDYTIVLGITGPTATCTAGPAGGSSGFGITRTIASGTVDFQYKGKSVIGGAKTIGTNGDFLAPIINGPVNKAIKDFLAAEAPGLTITLQDTPGGGSKSGPDTSAHVGSFSVTVNGITAVTFTGGVVSCGANQPLP